MYEEFFGLTEKPFSIQPDPSFLYWGRSHRLAYAMLEYGVLNHAGISVITGEVGCGKTTLVHRLLDQLSGTHSVALLSNIQSGRGDLLSWVLMGFGQPFTGKSHVELFSQLQDFFISEYAKGRRVILIIDEAQNLSVDMLEELRMLSNINAGKDQLLQLILVGQPQLKDLLNRPDMLQLAQRIGSDFHLTPLSREEVDAYIETRLAIAGASQPLFTKEAVDLVAEHSRGVPRVINIIADTALVYAFSAQESEVGAEIVRNVVRDKVEFGVFGIATRGEAEKPPPESGKGPDAFVREPRRDPDRSGADAREPKPSLARRISPLAATGRARRDDEPRMPSVRRLAPAQSAPAASSALARQEPAADPTPAPTRIEAKAPRSRQPAASSTGTVRALRAVPSGPETPSGLDVSQLTRLGVVVVGAHAGAEATIGSAAGAPNVIYVAQAGDEALAEAARAAGAEALVIADRALSPGRARNAGYRHLKKQTPDLRYVQFVDAGFVLDPEWLDAAARFMDRRPEVAVVEGAVDGKGARRDPSDDGEGERQITGSTAFVRADAFESAGGFRGDLIVNETADLCIRLRRRGAHVWRLGAPMGAPEKALAKVGGWWAHAFRRGFCYAHGADLHGAPPERLYVGELWRAIIWGAVAPFAFISAAAAAAGFTALYAPLVSPFAVAGGVLGIGALVYLAKIAIAAIRTGPFRTASWSAACGKTFSHLPEFFGVWRFRLGRARLDALARQA